MGTCVVSISEIHAINSRKGQVNEKKMASATEIKRDNEGSGKTYRILYDLKTLVFLRYYS